MECKFGSQCLRPNCSYAHPDGYNPESNSNPLLNKLFKSQMTRARTAEPKVYETMPSDPHNPQQLDLEYGDNFEPESLFEENDMDGESRKARLEAQENEDAKGEAENGHSKDSAENENENGNENGNENENEVHDDM